MTVWTFMLYIVLFLTVTMGGILLVSEIVMRIEDWIYKDAEDGGDWMDV